jgi:3-oxoacyl-[acyl-carrier protein] reductase
MDLGIARRKAIVCASSRGFGRACTKALAEAGCEVVINGRDRDQFAATAEELRHATGAKIMPIVADVASAVSQKALFDACPDLDIPINIIGQNLLIDGGAFPGAFSARFPARRLS